MHHRLAIVAALLGPVAAQGAPTFLPKPGALAHLRIDDIPALAAALPKTRLGRLFAEADVAAAWTAGTERLRKSRAAHAQVRRAALDLHVELPAWQSTREAESMFWSVFEQFELTELRDVARIALPSAGDDSVPQTREIMTVRCTPRVEGKATQGFEVAARDIASSRWLLPIEDAKVDGFPAHMFDCKLPESDESMSFQPLGVWMLHLPGTFAFGTGKPEECGTVGPAPAASPGVTCTFDLQAYLAMFTRGGMPVPPEVAILGLDSLRSLQWGVRFDGESVLDEVEVAFTEAPKGILASLFAGSAALPAQAMPEGALLQLRAAVDVKVLLEAARQLPGSERVLAGNLGDELDKVLTGGLAIGVAAPAPGGVVPRLFLTLGIRDEAAVGALLGKLLGKAGKQLTQDGHTLTVVKVEGLPPALQPTFCVREGTLHVAESVASMRALLKALTDGGDAMAVGDAKVPEGPGTVQATFDLRWDEAAIYRAFHGVWLPLFELAMPRDENLFAAPLVSREDLPEPDVVAPHLGARRGVLLRDGATWVFRMAGTAGGPELAALAMAWGPMLSGRFLRDYETVQLARTVGRHRLAAVWPALQAFRDQHKRWPNDLGELFVAAKLPADALLVPGDDQAEAVAMPAGNALAVRSSFRYFPGAVDFEASNGAVRALLVEVRPRPYQRLVLAEDGAIPDDVFGVASDLPIDKIGK